MTYLCLFRMFPVCFHSFRGYLHIVEHALHPLSELSTAFDLELGKHATFGVIRYGTIEKKAFR